MSSNIQDSTKQKRDAKHKRLERLGTILIYVPTISLCLISVLIAWVFHSDWWIVTLSLSLGYFIGMDVMNKLHLTKLKNLGLYKDGYISYIKDN